jgi:hypothetical protein
MGGRYVIPVSAEHRAAAGVQAGDQLQRRIARVVEELGSGARQVPISLVGLGMNSPRGSR